MKDYNRIISITKEEKITGSPLYLRLGSSCGDGEWFLFSVDRPNEQASFQDAIENKSGGSYVFNTQSV